MFNSLRVSLTLLFVSLTVFPLIIVGALIASQSFETLQNQTIEFQEQLAQKTAISLGAFFSERENELQVLTNTYGLDTLSRNAQRDVLLVLLSQQQAYYELTLVNRQGQETIRLTRGEIVTDRDLTNRAADPLFQQAILTNAVSFSPVYFNENARDRLITVAVPIENLFSGQTENVLVAEIRFQNIEETVLRNLQIEEGEDVFVVDSNGVVVAHRNPNLVLRETFFEPPATNGRYAGLENDDVILATEPLSQEDLGLFVVAQTEYAKATALATDLSQLAILITAVTLVVASAIVAVVVRRVVNPIVKLSDVARAIQTGDFSQHVSLDRRDEIGQFAAAFNAMTDAIEKRETDLHEQADALRIATAKAREAARLKGEFLANVSHELRTPLNAIIGFSDMLLAGMSGPLNEKQTHKMARLKENGSRLLNLINDLLDLTRIESGRLEMVVKPFSPHTVAERISAQMESIAAESKLHFETVISPNLPEVIAGDEKRVEQVLVNLLSNAFKFTKEGSVTLTLDANLEDEVWSLEVSDTGIGIPPHAVNVIFEEFRQLDGSYSRAYKGSGLGLAITRNIVRVMGGKIGVKSTLGVGSTFTVVLPMNQKDATHALILEAATN